MVEEKTVWKFKVSTWTTIIATTQIVYNGLSTIGSIYSLVMLQSVTLYIAALMLSIFGLLNGIFLLLGMRRQKTTLLMFWMGSAASLTVVFSVSVFAGSGRPLDIIFCVLAVPIHIFGIWIVYTFKKELKQQQEAKAEG